MKNVTENNKLIAEFMEYPKHKIDFVGKRLNFENSKHNTYHIDWNWLMKLIEKILNVSLELDSMEMYYNITDSIPDIVKTYGKSVEFIKWYNEQNKNNESL